MRVVIDIPYDSNFEANVRQAIRQLRRLLPPGEPAVAGDVRAAPVETPEPCLHSLATVGDSFCPRCNARLR